MPTRLIVLRHAKSAWPDGVPDLDRPLADRGRRDAPRMGAWLREAGLRPELVLCSPARRTRETWALAGEALGGPEGGPILAMEPRLYGAEVEELLEVLREVPAEVTTVLVVAHFPGVQGLVLELVGHQDGPDLDRVREKFPTAGVAVLELGSGWSALRRGAGTLTAFAVPRDLSA